VANSPPLAGEDQPGGPGGPPDVQHTRRTGDRGSHPRQRRRARAAGVDHVKHADGRDHVCTHAEASADVLYVVDVSRGGRRGQRTAPRGTTTRTERGQRGQHHAASGPRVHGPTLRPGRERQQPPGRHIVVRRCRAEPRARGAPPPRSRQARRTRTGPPPPQPCRCRRAPGPPSRCGRSAACQGPGHRPSDRSAATSPVTPSQTRAAAEVPGPVSASRSSIAPSSRASGPGRRPGPPRRRGPRRRTPRVGASRSRRHPAQRGASRHATGSTAAAASATAEGGGRTSDEQPHPVNRVRVEGREVVPGGPVGHQSASSSTGVNLNPCPEEPRVGSTRGAAPGAGRPRSARRGSGCTSTRRPGVPGAELGSTSARVVATWSALHASGQGAGSRSARRP
jgi:hypothetical protein